MKRHYGGENCLYWTESLKYGVNIRAKAVMNNDEWVAQIDKWWTDNVEL